jgi:hypothetical protein
MQSVTERVHAYRFSDFLEMAQHLSSEGYKDAAAVLAGSVLEEHLRKLCDKNGLSVTDANGKPLKADRINADLKGANVYSGLDQKQVTAWLDLRNKAAHGHYTEYTQPQVDLMISGTELHRQKSRIGWKVVGDACQPQTPGSRSGYDKAEQLRGHAGLGSSSKGNVTHLGVVGYFEK